MFVFQKSFKYHKCVYAESQNISVLFKILKSTQQINAPNPHINIKKIMIKRVDKTNYTKAPLGVDLLHVHFHI